jgi:hypothetical protein
MTVRLLYVALFVKILASYKFLFFIGGVRKGGRGGNTDTGNDAMRDAMEFSLYTPLGISTRTPAS